MRPLLWYPSHDITSDNEWCSVDMAGCQAGQGIGGNCTGSDIGCYVNFEIIRGFGAKGALSLYPSDLTLYGRQRVSPRFQEVYVELTEIVSKKAEMLDRQAF